MTRNQSFLFQGTSKKGLCTYVLIGKPSLSPDCSQSRVSVSVESSMLFDSLLIEYP